MRKRAVSVAFLLLLTPALMLAQDAPGDTPAAKPNLSPMRLVKLKAITFLYTSIPFSNDGMAAAIHNQVVAMEAAMKSAGIWPSGPAIMVFHGVGAGKRPTSVDVGLPVADETAAVGGFQIGKLESALEATAVYSGPLGQIDLGRLYSQIIAAGHVPSDVMRQRTLYFESETSPNNVTLIEIPLQN